MPNACRVEGPGCLIVRQAYTKRDALEVSVAVRDGPECRDDPLDVPQAHEFYVVKFCRFREVKKTC